MEKIQNLDRQMQAEKLVDFLHKTKAEKVFSSEENKKEFLQTLTFEEFIKWLERMNGILRDISLNKRSMDGTDVILSSPLGIDAMPPRHEDKDELLEKLFEELQNIDVKDVPFLLSTAVTAIHPFADGNGRTSRLLFALFHKNYEGNDEQDQFIKDIVGDDGRHNLDTSWAPVEVQIENEIRRELIGPYEITTPTNLFPDWIEAKQEANNTSLTEDDYKILQKLDRDSADEFFAVFTYLKNSELLEKCIKPIYNNGKQTRAIIDLELVTPYLTSEKVKELETLYWNIKKNKVEKLIDVFVNPENHLLPKENGVTDQVTLKDFLEKEILSTIK